MDYESRRNRLAELMLPKSAAVIINPAASHKTGDQDYPYRADSNMIYLCGMDEPEAVAVIFGRECAHSGMVMFSLPPDPERAKWVGPRYGSEGARSKFGATEWYPVDEFEKKLGELIFDLDNVYFDFSYSGKFAPVLFGATERLRHRGRRASEGPRSFVDIRDILGEMRRIKDGDEIEVMKKAAGVSKAGFVDALAVIAPGVGEWQVEATLQHAFRRAGAVGESFGAICAGGVHATTLHYEDNSDVLKDGDLILIDAGAEVGYYAGDISRTFPVNGKFTEPQRTVYSLVLKAQKAGIEECVVGNNMKSPHERVRRIFAEGLREMGIFDESVSEILEKNLDFEYYFHGTSHYLGIDTHDVGTSYRRHGDAPETLVSGVVLTVEPGLYFDPNDTRVPEQYRGIGIRIEDDVLVTDNGPVVLTDGLVKEIDDIENAMAIARGKRDK